MDDQPETDHPDRQGDGDPRHAEDRPTASFDGGETLDDAALRAAFAPARTSIVATLEKTFGISSRVLLRQISEERDGVVLPRGAGRSPAGEDGGRYEIQGELARGGVGIVLKGRDRDLGRDVAIKVLHPRHARRAGMVQRFIEEAQIAGQLQHPGVLPVFELGYSDDRRLFFSMKLIQGETLAALLHQRPTPAEERQRFLTIFESVCQTMAYAHAKGVVHRDLKPANVMVGAFGEVQVVDWGLGKVLPHGGTADERNAWSVQRDDPAVRTVRSGEVGSRSVVGSIMGTPAYMPPEQARGEVERLDERSDVFALGAILCEILTGEPPYAGPGTDSIERAAEGRLDEARARLDGCGADPELVGLCHRCLAAEPRHRPRNAGIVARELSTYLTSLERRAHEMELAAAEAAAKAREERRARRLTAGLAAAVLATVVVIAGGVFQLREERVRQQIERTHAVSEALDHATARLAEARTSTVESEREWAEAQAAGRHLESLLATGSVDAKTRQRATAFLAELGQADRDRRMMERIENLTLIGSSHMDLESWLWMDDQFAAAFRDYGIDVEALSQTEVLERIRGSAMVEDLAYAFDLWVRTSFYVTLEGHSRYTFQELMPRLETLYQADPDPFRTRLRRFVFAPAPTIEELDEMIASSDLEALPARTLTLLVSNFGRVGYADGWQDLCRSGFLRFPGAVELIHTCGLLFANTQSWHEAARYYTSAVTLRPETGGLWRSLGRALRELGDDEGSAATLRRAAHFQGDFAPNHLDLGISLVAANRPDEAIGAFRGALQIRPEMTEGYARLGRALRALGRFDEAADALDRCYELGRGSDVAALPWFEACAEEPSAHRSEDQGGSR